MLSTFTHYCRRWSNSRESWKLPVSPRRARHEKEPSLHRVYRCPRGYVLFKEVTSTSKRLYSSRKKRVKLRRWAPSAQVGLAVLAFSVVDGAARRGTPRETANDCCRASCGDLVTCTYFLVTGKVTPRLNASELQAERAKELTVLAGVLSVDARGTSFRRDATNTH